MFQVADHHLVVGLLAPADIFGGIRIRWVFSAVVKDGGDFEGGAAWEEAGHHVVVAELPVEVVARDVEQSLGLSIG